MQILNAFHNLVSPYILNCFFSTFSSPTVNQSYGFGHILCLFLCLIHSLCSFFSWMEHQLSLALLILIEQSCLSQTELQKTVVQTDLDSLWNSIAHVVCNITYVYNGLFCVLGLFVTRLQVDCKFLLSRGQFYYFNICCYPPPDQDIASYKPKLFQRKQKFFSDHTFSQGMVSASLWFTQVTGPSSLAPVQINSCLIWGNYFLLTPTMWFKWGLPIIVLNPPSNRFYK